MAMSLEEILERVQELKAEGQEKDEVICVQQQQIAELEEKGSTIDVELEKKDEVIQAQQEQIDELEKKVIGMESEMDNLRLDCECKEEAALKSAELVEKLSEMLD